MPIWVVLLLAVSVALGIGYAGAWYLQRIRLPREAAAAGVGSLADMRWREFIRLVVQALSERGYTVASEGEAGDDDILLKRDGQRWLLSSRHGASSAPNQHAISEFARDIRMKGAIGGLLVTPGRFAAAAAPLAQTYHVQLLDGPSLWPDLQRLLPPEQRRAILQPVRDKIDRESRLAWVGAAVAGLLLALALWPHGTRPPAPEATALRRQAAPQAAMTPARTPGDATATSAMPAADDTAALNARRQAVLRQAATLERVDRVVWATQSTLLVFLDRDDADPLPALCPILEQYDELRASRIQLQPPSGSRRPVRFVQCHTF